MFKRQEKSKKAAKKALIDRNLTITELAHNIGHSRPAVSRAINHGHCPGVWAKIKLELGI